MPTLYEQWIHSCEMANIEPFSIDTAARLSAIAYVYTPSEEFTHNPKAMADMGYISRRYRLYGGEVPDSEFTALLRGYVKDLEANTMQIDAFQCKPADWAVQMYKERYNIKVLV